MKKNLLVAILVGFIGLLGVSGLAFAECPDLVDTTEQTNDKYLKEATKFAEEALEHAKQGHAPETRASTKSAIGSLKCIVTTTGESQIQRPKTRFKQAGIAAKKGDTEKAVALLEEGIAQIKEVNLTPKGLGD